MVAYERSVQKRSHSPNFETDALKTLHGVIIEPIVDLIRGNTLIVVPEGPLCLAPYAAFMDLNSKFLCESFRIRVIPSLTCIKLITDCAVDYHSKSGALLVGDPCVQEVTKLQKLPCAKKKVEMIGQILPVAPLVGTGNKERSVKVSLISCLGAYCSTWADGNGRNCLGTKPHTATPTSRR